MDINDGAEGGQSIGAYIEGGMGGEAQQPDGRGGRGGLAPQTAELSLHGSSSRAHMKRPYWGDDQVEFGRGGDAPDSIQYRARRLIVEMIKAEYLAAPSYFTTPVWYERDVVPLDAINASLARQGMNWRVSIADHEYAMDDLPSA